MIDTIRRVVTGHDESGKAIVVFDSNAANVHERAAGTGATHLWRTHSTPADNSGAEDTVTGDVPLAPPPGGSVFRVVEFAPVGDAAENMAPDALAREIGAHSAAGAAQRHPLTHRTDSIDYAIIMSGEIDMLLDEDDLHLKAGDIVVQRGTNHAWVNRSSEPCKIAFVLIDAVAAI